MQTRDRSSAKVTAMPVKTRNCNTQADGICHVGPTAQDFQAPFGLGRDDKTIHTLDADGALFLSVKGLVEEFEECLNALPPPDTP